MKKRLSNVSGVAAKASLRLDSVAQDVAPSGLIAGKYRLTTLIGRGGMGSVWEGTHTTLGTQVAVKFIDAEYAESPEARNRFESEARAAARLRSKHVVEVYDHGMTDDGRPFIVMEFLRGEPLDARLDRVGRLPAKETARIVMQVCRALSKAHAAGIVHRDLKPENVFLVWDDEDGADVAKVVDFGIAKFTDSQLGNSSATRTGSVLGTPYYMSPEQARGLRSVDYRSDLWSVGVIAYRCIVGSLPFDGEAVGDLLVKLCTAPLPVPSHVAPDVPPGFDAWFEKALARDPAGRFASASELAESMAGVCGLSVRGSYATADIPIPSFASGPSAASGSRLPAVQPVTPYPALRADASGPNPAIANASTLQMATGAPTTQTPAPHPTRGSGRLIALAALGVVVLGVGVGLGFKFLGGGVTQPPAHTEAVAAVDNPPPIKAPAPAQLAPAPSATVEPVVASPKASSAEAAAPPPTAARPVAPPTTPVVAAVPRPPHQHAPAPPPKPASKPPGSQSGTADVGF
jgi:serine/threonine protein kinase